MDLMKNQYADLKKKLQQAKSELDRVLQKAHRDDSAKNELKEKLALAETEYLDARGRLSTLVKELSEKTFLLERKSSALRELEERDVEERDVEEENEVRAERRWQNDYFQMETARKVSQKDYLAEINVGYKRFYELLVVILFYTNLDYFLNTVSD